MKSERQKLILELISKKAIFTQEELTAALGAAGFSVAQATVSRDIRELGVVKEPMSQRYITSRGEGSAFARVFSDGLVSVENAGNMMVIKTLSGMAMAVAVALDKLEFSEILGTVAGDDCVICVVRNARAAASLVEKLKP
jgi:transcriptional regulator of arginine metabolism